jgi:hypothetical protein
MANKLKIRRSQTNTVASAGALEFGELVYTEVDGNFYVADSSNTAVQIGKETNGSTTEFLRGDGTWAAPAGAGDVVGPASSTDNTLPRYDGTTGKLIQGSGVVVDDLNNMSGVGTLNGATLPSSGTILTDNDIGTSVQGYDANNALTTDITYETLSANGDVGTGSAQVAQGNHLHTGVYEPVDATIIRTSNADASGFSFVVDEDDMLSNSATKVPTQQSVKAYVDAVAASEMTYRGGYDASTNTPDLDTAPSGISVGDMFTVTVAGTFFATAVEAGDVLIAEQTDPTTEAHWTIVNKNLDSVASAGTTLTAGVGLAGGGDLSANRTFDLDFNELTAQTDGLGTNEIAVQLTGGGAFRKMTVANFLDGGTF